jgi:hypothetical protein
MIYMLLIALVAYGVMFTWAVLKAKKETNK